MRTASIGSIFTYTADVDVVPANVDVIHADVEVVHAYVDVVPANVDVIHSDVEVVHADVDVVPADVDVVRADVGFAHADVDVVPADFGVNYATERRRALLWHWKYESHRCTLIKGRHSSSQRTSHNKSTKKSLNLQVRAK